MLSPCCASALLSSPPAPPDAPIAASTHHCGGHQTGTCTASTPADAAEVDAPSASRRTSSRADGCRASVSRRSAIPCGAHLRGQASARAIRAQQRKVELPSSENDTRASHAANAGGLRTTSPSAASTLPTPRSPCPVPLGSPSPLAAATAAPASSTAGAAPAPPPISRTGRTRLRITPRKCVRAVSSWRAGRRPPRNRQRPRQPPHSRVGIPICHLFPHMNT